MTEQQRKREIGRRERRRIETREKLYRTAMDLFARRGFSQTTTEDITEAADVGQGTFFNYFPTKAHVMLALSEKQLEKISAAVAEAEAGAVPMHQLLRRFIHVIVEELVRSQALARSLFTTFVSQDDVRGLMSDTLGQGRQRLAKMFALGQQRGEIRRDRKPLDLALAFQRNVFGTLLLWAMQSKGDVHSWLEKTLEDFWDAAAASRR
ncbi:MAG TPA: helix-turn-helix domain-containing protein [Terriglobales bacterium]